jgi:hypothetical protein
MKGVLMTVTKGFSGAWPGGDFVEFAIADVVALGKQRRYDDFVTRLVARLADGREAMIEAEGRTEDEQRWLREQSKRVPFSMASRDCPEVTSWVEVTR